MFTGGLLSLSPTFGRSPFPPSFPGPWFPAAQHLSLVRATLGSNWGFGLELNAHRLEDAKLQETILKIAVRLVVGGWCFDQCNASVARKCSGNLNEGKSANFRLLIGQHPANRVLVTAVDARRVHTRVHEFRCDMRRRVKCLFRRGRRTVSSKK